MVDVYHECTDPEITLQGLRKALKPKGRLVLVEFRGEDETVPIKPEHKMTLDQVRREVEPQGFSFKESLEFLPWQHVIIFEKPAESCQARRREKRRRRNRAEAARRTDVEALTGSSFNSARIRMVSHDRTIGTAIPGAIHLFGAHARWLSPWIWKRRNTSLRSLRRPSTPAA